VAIQNNSALPKDVGLRFAGTVEREGQAHERSRLWRWRRDCVTSARNRAVIGAFRQGRLLDLRTGGRSIRQPCKYSEARNSVLHLHVNLKQMHAEHLP
jgi:hypothetical protein